MFKKLLFVFIFSFLFITPVLADTSFTDAPGPYLGLEYGRATGLGTQDVRLTAARIINSVIGLLGIVATVIVAYAGFKWMTSGGNEEQAGGAKKMLYAGVIGIVIILSAYSISKFALTKLFEATTGSSYNSIWDNP